MLYARREDPLLRILGISLGHDSSFALVEDGRISAILEAERLFRQKRYKLHCVSLDPGKHDSGFQLTDVDDLRRMLASVASGWGASYDGLAVQNQGRTQEYDNLLGLVREAGIRFGRSFHVDHHLSHASLAYYTSPFRDALVLSFDGMGNDGQTVLFRGVGNHLEYLERDARQFGRSYNNLGYMLRIHPDVAGSTAGKTMGLAAYGELRRDWLPFASEYVTRYTKLPPRPIEGLDNYGKAHRINSIALDRIPDLQPFVQPATTEEPSGWRARLGAWTRATPDAELQLPGADHPLAQSLAHTVQHAWTEQVLDLLSRFRASSRNLCIVGGCALNGITNYAIEQSGMFERAHFVPNPTDCGLSAGAALHAYFALSGTAFDGMPEPVSAYLGSEPFDGGDLPAFKSRYPHRTIERGDDAIAATVASLIHRDQIVGVVRGRYEVGPRALGNRSILGNPLNPNMRQVLNDRVKHREWYRPFAPVVTAENAPTYFTNTADIPYMSVICFTRPEYRAMLPSITHVDGSARVQTVRQSQHPFLHATLKAFERLSNVPVLLNTSFNPGGEPILNYCSVALEMLDKTGLDLVLIGDTLFAKRGEDHRLLDATSR